MNTNVDKLLCDLIGKIEIANIAIKQTMELIEEIKKYENYSRDNGVSYGKKNTNSKK